jgi:large subunit ribosomal protein L4
MHQAVQMYQDNLRVGTAQAKTRGEVCYTKRKPWRQKHTGRARSGTKSSPVWVGGGVVFGPRARDFSWSMPKKSRRLALKSALLSKFQDSEVLALKALDLDTPRTKVVSEFLKKLGLNGDRVLFVSSEVGANTVLSVRNIPKAAVMRLDDLNAYEVLRHKRIIFTQSALDVLSKEAAQ